MIAYRHALPVEKVSLARRAGFCVDPGRECRSPSPAGHARIRAHRL